MIRNRNGPGIICPARMRQRSCTTLSTRIRTPCREAPDSGQATLRHPKLAVYRCFLPDLTEFTGLRRVEPSLHYPVT